MIGDSVENTSRSGTRLTLMRFRFVTTAASWTARDTLMPAPSFGR